MSYQDNQNPTDYVQQTSSLAVISLIAGIASYIVLPLLGAIAAIITGNLAKKEINQNAGRMTGMGMATWGVILGWINVGISLIGLCLLVLTFAGVFMLPFANNL